MSLPEYQKLMANEVNELPAQAAAGTRTHINYTVDCSRFVGSAEHVRARAANSKHELREILSQPGLYPRLASIPLDRIIVSLPFEDCQMRMQGPHHEIRPQAVTQWARLTDDAWEDEAALNTTSRMMVSVRRNPADKMLLIGAVTLGPLLLMAALIAMLAYMD